MRETETLSLRQTETACFARRYNSEPDPVRDASEFRGSAIATPLIVHRREISLVKQHITEALLYLARVLRNERATFTVLPEKRKQTRVQVCVLFLPVGNFVTLTTTKMQDGFEEQDSTH